MYESACRSAHGGPDPAVDLAVVEAGGVQLPVADGDNRDPQDILPLGHRIGRDVDPLDREWPVEPDPTEGTVDLLAQMAARALVQGDVQRRRAMRAQSNERKAAPEVPTKHG